jgi:hypothetical protein
LGIGYRSVSLSLSLSLSLLAASFLLNQLSFLSSREQKEVGKKKHLVAVINPSLFGNFGLIFRVWYRKVNERVMCFGHCGPKSQSPTREERLRQI